MELLDNDIKHQIQLKSKTASDVLAVLLQLRNRRGRLTRNLKFWSRPQTRFTSIQGKWRPEVFSQHTFQDVKTAKQLKRMSVDTIPTIDVEAVSKE